MTLAEIIQADAEYMKNVSVDVDGAFGTVCISDDEGDYEDIFMQGDEAIDFIEKAQDLWEEAGSVSMTDVELHLAKPYVENLGIDMALQGANDLRPERKESTVQGWKILLNGRHVNTVFYLKDMTAEEVKRSLVRHDGYPQEIKVIKND